MAKINVHFTNEKGNVVAKMRDGLRKQVEEKILNVLTDAEMDVVKNVNGGLSVAIAVDSVTGKTVYAHLPMTISTKDPNEKVEKKTAKQVKKEAHEEVVPDLF